VCVSLRHYMYLPLEKQKPCISVLSQWENRTYRLHTSNILDKMARLFVRAQKKNQFIFTLAFKSLESPRQFGVHTFIFQINLKMSIKYS